MALYADTVIMCRKQEERDAAGYVTRIDNVPTLLSGHIIFNQFGVRFGVRLTNAN